MNTKRRLLRSLLPLLSFCCFLSTSILAAEEVKLLKDLPYKSAANTDYEKSRCKVDLYLPDGKLDFATIVWFHGGGLQGGDKAGGFAEAMGKRFASGGIAVASVNYRLHPQVSFPAYIDDAAAAVSFIKQEIAKHGGSPEKIFVSGHSAGGYLTAMIGLDEQYLAKYGLRLKDLAGMMPISGQMITHSTVREERKIARTQPVIDEAAPAFHVSKEAPAFLVIAGGEDLPTRAEENQYFVAAMKATGHPDTTYLEVAGRNHGSIANQLGNSNDIVAKTMIEFIEQHSQGAK